MSEKMLAKKIEIVPKSNFSKIKISIHNSSFKTSSISTTPPRGANLLNTCVMVK